MLAPELHPELTELLIQGNEVALAEYLSEWQAPDLAELIHDLRNDESQARVFTAIDAQLKAETFDFLEFDVQDHLLETLPPQSLASILEDMSPDDRTELLEQLPGFRVTQLITMLSPSQRSVALSLLGYPEDSVGRLMTPDYIAVRQDWTVLQALDHIRRYGEDSETLNNIYVTEGGVGGKLLDDLRVREFLLAPPSRKVSELMDDKFTALLATDDQEHAVNFFSGDNRYAVPVVDDKGYMLGIVTLDDILEVAQEEGTEDIQKMGAVEALDESYLDTSIPRMIRARGGWLIVLFFGEMLTATAMGFFEGEIEKAVVLALFVPLIISSGGNTGSQAATLVIRAMALQEVSIKDWVRVFKRELLSGLALGGVLGFLGFLRIAVWSTFSDMYGPHWFLIALTVGISLMGVVLWGTLTGSMLPLVLRKLGFDPATSSAPFVATLIDVTGLIIYFSVALLLLKGTIL